MSLYASSGIIPAWEEIAGWIMVGFVFLVLVLVALIKVLQSSGNCTTVSYNATLDQSQMGF